MVYKGPSHGCATCIKRRIKCDERRPACGNCTKREQDCPGYRDGLDIMFKDQTASVSQKVKRRQAAKEKKRVRERLQSQDSEDSFSSSSPDSVSSQSLQIPTMPVDHEAISLCFFFTNYIAKTRNPTVSRGYFEYLLPVYSRAMPSSTLSLAASAVAINMSQMWRQRGPDTILARSIFQEALISLKSAISDPVQSTADETLFAVLLLELYESISGRFQNKVSSTTHQRGALALIKHRGPANFQSEIGKRLLIAVRNQIITQAVQSKKKIVFDPETWDDQDEMPVNPAINLDRLVAELANLQVEEVDAFQSNLSPQTPTSTSAHTSSDSTRTQSLFNAALELETRLGVWTTQVPDDWHPVPVSSPDLVHPSIFEAGVYGDTCDVYCSVFVTALHNECRCARLAVLKIILKCCSVIGNELMEGCKPTEEYARREIQALVDEICASLPFFLGNRTTFGALDETEHVSYPQMPPAKDEFTTADPEMFQYALKMTRREHARDAAATGGHFLISTLFAVIRTVQDPQLAAVNGRPLLREGQMKWILEQLDRVRVIYRIPRPAKALA